MQARTPALLRSAYLLTGDQHLAEDLVQSALVRTHRAWSRVSALGNAEAYTRKAMYHLQISWWRRRRVAEPFPSDALQAAAPAEPDHAEMTALRLSVRTALGQLPPRQRAAVVLRFFDDLTEAQAVDAEVLGLECPVADLTAGSTRQLHFRFVTTWTPVGSDATSGPDHRDYSVVLSQLPPYVYEHVTDVLAAAIVVVAP